MAIKPVIFYHSAAKVGAMIAALRTNLRMYYYILAFVVQAQIQSDKSEAVIVRYSFAMIDIDYNPHFAGMPGTM